MSNIQMYGVKETLNELRKFDRDLFNNLRKDLKTSAVPLAKAVGQDFPAKPLSGWLGAGRTVSGFPRYTGSTAQRGVKVAKITTTRRNPNILRIVQGNPAGAVFDGAGSKATTAPAVRFVRNLDSKTPSRSAQGRTRSRVLYPSVKRQMPLVEGAVTKALQNIEQQTTNRILKAGGF